MRLMGCRGVATFPEGVPEPPGTLRMMWSARGVRVGISSISRTQCFWFTTLTCPEVCPVPTYISGFQCLAQSGMPQTARETSAERAAVAS